MAKLTAKQQIFIEEYLLDLNATQAYLRAGYNVKSENVAKANASRLLTKANVQEAIQEAMQEISSSKIADVAEILEYLTKGMRQELHEEVVVIENIGGYQSEARAITKKIAIKDSNKCAELLAKRFGLLTENINLYGDIGVKIVDDIE